MKYQDLIPSLILLLVMTFITVDGMSQKTLKNFDDSLSKTAYVINKGDSVSVAIDSTIIMNKMTFNLYQRYYDRGRSANTSYKGVLNYYEDIIRKQDSMLVEKESYYRQLNSKFELLTGSAKSFMDQTGTSLQSVSNALGSAQVQLTQTQVLLTEANKMLSAERRKSNLKALKFGIGGVLIGGILGAILIH